MRKKWEKNHLYTNRDKRYNNVTEQYSKANSITALPMRTKSWSLQFKFECIFITSLVHRNMTVVQLRQFVILIQGDSESIYILILGIISAAAFIGQAQTCNYKDLLKCIFFFEEPLITQLHNILYIVVLTNIFNFQRTVQVDYINETNIHM